MARLRQQPPPPPPLRLRKRPKRGRVTRALRLGHRFNTAAGRACLPRRVAGATNGASPHLAVDLALARVAIRSTRSSFRTGAVRPISFT